MVIIRTSATEVSIQAVSPEFGVHFSRTAFFGSGSAAQAGGVAAASGAGAAAGAAGAAAGAWASDGVTEVTEMERPSSAPRARATSPARVTFFFVMVELLFARFKARAITAPQRRFHRCGCARRGR